MIDEHVHNYILHKPPVVLIDKLVFADDESVEAIVDINKALIFADDKGVPSWLAIEMMAQTISVYAGVQGKILNRPPKIGYLLGTRKLELPVAYFEHGERLRITARRQYLHEGLGQFKCEIFYKEHCLTALLSVFEPL